MAKAIEFHPKHSFLPATGHRARELGELLYFTGKRCTKGHLSPRYASSANCVECIGESRGKVIKNYRGKSSIRSPENQERAEKAFADGFVVYKSIKPCPKGHFERSVTTNNCVECSNAQNRKRKESLRWARIKKEYGIGKSEVEAMLHSQKFQCAICNDDISSAYHIDHCHSKGHVRGLLCSRCNQAIGLFRESLTFMERAAIYLRESNAAS